MSDQNPYDSSSDGNEYQDSFAENTGLLLDFDEQGKPSSGLRSFTPPALFGYEYLASRDNLFPGKTEMSEFLIEHILDERPFNLLFLNAANDYHGANIWNKFLNAEVLKNINEGLYASQCDFLHASLATAGQGRDKLYLLHFDKQAIGELKAIILHALTKTHALGNHDISNDTLNSYRKFMDGMPKIGFNLTDVSGELYRLYEGLWDNKFIQLDFFNDFDSFDFELCAQIDGRKKDAGTREYAYLSLKSKGGINSALAIDLYDFIEEYQKQNPTVAMPDQPATPQTSEDVASETNNQSSATGLLSKFFGKS